MQIIQHQIGLSDVNDIRKGLLKHANDVRNLAAGNLQDDVPPPPDQTVIHTLTFFEKDLINGFHPRGYDGFLSHSDIFRKIMNLAIFCKYCQYLCS